MKQPTRAALERRAKFLKISKLKKGVKLVRLADFGAESSGYYSHDNKYTCKPEHVQALRSFARSFKSLARKGV